jgi:calcium/calmodulin-dependent protein kinase I
MSPVKQGEDYDLSENIRENFNAKKKWKDAIRIIQASNKFKMAATKTEALDTDESDGGFGTADSDDDEAIKKPSQGSGLAGLVSSVNKMSVKE